MSNDPAVYLGLNADANRKALPNENVVRQLMDQLSLGPGHYGEEDIREAARAFTGWFVLRGTLRFFDREHDSGEKTILGTKGPWNANDVLRIVLDQPAAPRNLVRRLYRWFLSEVDEPADACWIRSSRHSPPTTTSATSSRPCCARICSFAGSLPPPRQNARGPCTGDYQGYRRHRADDSPGPGPGGAGSGSLPAANRARLLLASIGSTRRRSCDGRIREGDVGKSGTVWRQAGCRPSGGTRRPLLRRSAAQLFVDLFVQNDLDDETRKALLQSVPSKGAKARAIGCVSLSFAS